RRRGVDETGKGVREAAHDGPEDEPDRSATLAVLGSRTFWLDRTEATPGRSRIRRYSSAEWARVAHRGAGESASGGRCHQRDEENSRFHLNALPRGGRAPGPLPGCGRVQRST